MGIEIELKFLLTDSLEKIINKFGDCVKQAKRTYQKTVMFDNEQRLMEKTNGRIRLRQNGDIVTMSYKLPLPSEDVKKEIEWETKVDSWEIGKNIIKAMGFNETTSYERYRTSFIYKDVEIEIDEYPFANFIEIEGEELKIREIAKEINFDIKNALKDPCDTLFTKWRLEKGLPMKFHMRFDDYDR
ncbi:MAG: class IV adenylate cyclase [Candidatus Parcubacteria bacterium]|nr:class IV adenylate cyclase [Candidatus Parcubacteria bacterium]